MYLDIILMTLVVVKAYCFEGSLFLNIRNSRSAINLIHLWNFRFWIFQESVCKILCWRFSLKAWRMTNGQKWREIPSYKAVFPDKKDCFFVGYLSSFLAICRTLWQECIKDHTFEELQFLLYTRIVNQIGCWFQKMAKR